MKHQSIHKHAKQLDLVKRLAKMNNEKSDQSAQSVKIWKTQRITQ
ncbi:hypothetical protein [Acinetobacter pittii]|nr:hypothetical protein [Acinetobacter pittii]